MAGKGENAKLFRVLSTVVLGSKVVSTTIVKSISHSVHVIDEKTVFAEVIGKPGTNNNANVEERIEKTSEYLAQPGIASRPETFDEYAESKPEAVDEYVESKAEAADEYAESNPEAADEYAESKAKAVDEYAESKPEAVDEYAESKAEAVDEYVESKPGDVDDVVIETDAGSNTDKIDEETSKVAVESDSDNKDGGGDETTVKLDEHSGQAATANPTDSEDATEHEAEAHKRHRKLTKDSAATKIQALQRQRQARVRADSMVKHMKEQEEHRAATLIQAVQRRKKALEKYDNMRAESEAKGMSPLKATNALHDLISFAEQNDPSTIGKMVELVDAKADLNAESQDGYTAIALACYYQGEPVVRKLIELNAAVDVTGPQGETLLIAAATRSPCEPEIITLLMDYPEIREAVNATEHVYESSALFLLAQEYENSHSNHARCEDALRVVLDTENIQVDITNSSGVTALMMAVANGSHNVAEILIEYGANPNKTDTSGNSAMTIVHEDDDQMWQILGGEYADEGPAYTEGLVGEYADEAPAYPEGDQPPYAIKVE